MEAKRDEPLPIILVSAKDEESAALLISELIDNEVENNDKECGRVWRLENKYYTASARVLGAGHARAPAPSLVPHVEAHVVYLTPDEVAATAAAGAELVAARLARCAASVRAVAADCAHEPPALRAAALRARADLVPLRAPPPAAGLPRLRQVLHAHVWPGARMRRPAAPAPPPPDDDDEDEWGEWTSAAGEGAAFAAALRALPAAAAHARSPAPREERLARAEQVLALFCNAIGAPLD